MYISPRLQHFFIILHKKRYVLRCENITFWGTPTRIPTDVARGIRGKKISLNKDILLLQCVDLLWSRTAEHRQYFWRPRFNKPISYSFHTFRAGSVVRKALAIRTSSSFKRSLLPLIIVCEVMRALLSASPTMSMDASKTVPQIFAVRMRKR